MFYEQSNNFCLFVSIFFLIIINNVHFFFFFRYHTDDAIKQQMADLETKNFKVANFEANDNEISMVIPSLKITDDV